MSRAVYAIISDASDDNFVIKDIGHDMYPSITNDAEAVVKEVAPQMKEGQKLLYYDSDGDLDELLVKDGEFAGFAPYHG